MRMAALPVIPRGCAALSLPLECTEDDILVSNEGGDPMGGKEYWKASAKPVCDCELAGTKTSAVIALREVDCTFDPIDRRRGGDDADELELTRCAAVPKPGGLLRVVCFGLPAIP